MEERVICLQKDEKSARLHIFSAGEGVRTAVIMCPGGGFRQVAMEHEGRDFAPWFNDRHITYAVLEYRMPEGNGNLPIEDVRAAIKEMRAEGYIRIGIMGASIGGYIAGSAAVFLEGIERPNFQILLYPVISMLDSLTHLPSRERLLGSAVSEEVQQSRSLDLHVTGDTPSAFIVLTADDQAVSPVNSLRYYEALLKNDVRATLHIYPEGGHSFGFRDTFAYKPLWLAELDKFLSEEI